MVERIKYMATAQDLERIKLERPNIQITYDPWGELAKQAQNGFFITDRNPLDDGSGPFRVTEFKPDPVSPSTPSTETQP